MHALGQFPVPWRYVRLKIDDEDHGAYLQLQHPVDALRSAQVELASVVRRRKDFFRGEVRRSVRHRGRLREEGVPLNES
jgi:hypothetical protein